MNYLQYTFIVTPPEPGADILIALIADMGFESFESNETGFVAYIPDDLDPEEELSSLHFDDFSFTYQSTVITQVNWNEEWEKNFSPVIVNDNCIIRAPFHHPEKKYNYDLIIIPKMSFGTGHHDTTWLMCNMLFEIEVKDKTVLDMGCGTGVLAILAKKLGAKKVKGIDIDDWSVENAVENCHNNNCSDISIIKGDSSLLTQKEEYDVILANINKNVLKNDLRIYSSVLKPKGIVFLSGFFKTDCEELINLASTHYLELHKQVSKNDWAMLLLQKK